MEPIESPINIITRVAAVALPAKRFIHALGTLCTSGIRALGVSRDTYAEKEFAGIITSGVTAVETGGAFSAGDELMSDDTGRAVVASGGGKVSGIAVEASSGAGKFVAVKILVVLIVLMATLFTEPPVKAQSQSRSLYELVSDTKTAALHVASAPKYVLQSIVNSKADSLTIIAKISDSVTVNFQFLSTSPDASYLDNTIVIPDVTTTNAVKYTSATISVGARHQIATLAMNAKSTRSTTANITADGIKVWLYYHVKQR